MHGDEDLEFAAILESVERATTELEQLGLIECVGVNDAGEKLWRATERGRRVLGLNGSEAHDA